MSQTLDKVLSSKKKGTVLKRKDLIMQTYAVANGYKANETKSMIEAHKKSKSKKNPFVKARNEINDWGTVSSAISRRTDNGKLKRVSYGSYKIM